MNRKNNDFLALKQICRHKTDFLYLHTEIAGIAQLAERKLPKL